jgi:predicted RNase H-like HicB family nuclease
MIKDKDYYLNINYDIILTNLSSEDGGGYFAYYKDIPSITGDGESREEAIKDVKSAFDCYLDISLQNKDIIPEPQNLRKSKKINISMTLDRLHNLDIYAKKIGMSRSKVLTKLTDKLISGDIRI